MADPCISLFTATASPNGAQFKVELADMKATDKIVSAVVKVNCGTNYLPVTFDLADSSATFSGTTNVTTGSVISTAIQALSSSSATTQHANGYGATFNIYANNTIIDNTIATLTNGRKYNAIIKVILHGGKVLAGKAAVGASPAVSTNIEFTPSSVPGAPVLVNFTPLNSTSFTVQVSRTAISTGGSAIKSIEFSLSNQDGSSVTSVHRPWTTDSLTDANTTFELSQTDFTNIVDDAKFNLEACLVNDNGTSGDSNVLIVNTTNLASAPTEISSVTNTVNDVSFSNVTLKTPADASFAKMIGLVLKDQATTNPMGDVYYIWNGVDFSVSATPVTKDTTGSSSTRMKNSFTPYKFNVFNLAANIAYSFKIALINEYGEGALSTAFSITQKSAPSAVRSLSSSRIGDSAMSTVIADVKPNMLFVGKNVSAAALLRDVRYGKTNTAIDVSDFDKLNVVLNNDAVSLPLVSADLTWQQPANNFPIAANVDGAYSFNVTNINDNNAALQYALTIYRKNATTAEQSNSYSVIKSLINGAVGAHTAATWVALSPANKLLAVSNNDTLFKAVSGYFLVKLINSLSAAQLNLCKVKNDIPNSAPDRSISLKKLGYGAFDITAPGIYSDANVNDEVNANQNMCVPFVGGSSITVAVTPVITFI